MNMFTVEGFLSDAPVKPRQEKVSTETEHARESHITRTMKTT